MLVVVAGTHFGWSDDVRQSTAMFHVRSLATVMRVDRVVFDRVKKSRKGGFA